MPTVASQLIENDGAKVTLTTPAGKNLWDSTVGKYEHWIEWEPKAGCPPGFLAQKVKRDIKYQFARFATAASGDYTLNWEREQTIEAEYWEIWDVVVHRTGEVTIYPAVMWQSGQYATSYGAMALAALKRDTNKRPSTTPHMLGYRAHDLFEERSPDPNKGVKGTFKIKGSVYLLPSGDAVAERWVEDYLSSARRGMHFGTPACYTGGPLWQREGNFRKPADAYRIMTRFEAGEFYDVKAKHLTDAKITPKPGDPNVKTEWKSRPYPLRFWQSSVP